MIFKELVLENFGPYRGRNVINLTPQLDDKNAPIILIGGMNGGGKTTLIDSIRLALYGRRAECSNKNNLSYNDFLLQSINRNTKLTEETRIELTFEHLVSDQWIELKIVRHWHKNTKDGKDNLGVIEGEFPDLNLTDNWDEYIEDILPLGISNLFLFDGEQVKELAEQELPSPSVREAISSLLGLELADKLASDLEILVSRKKKSLNKNTDQRELTEIETELHNLEKQKKNLLQELEVAEKKLKLASKKYRQSSENLRVEGGKISARKYQLEENVKSITTEINTIREDLRNLATGVLPLGLIGEQLKKIKQQLKEEQKALELRSSYDLWQTKDKKLLDFLDTLAIDENQLYKIEGFLNQENDTLVKELNDIPLYLEADQKQLHSVVNIIDHSLPEQQQKVAQYLSQLKQLEADLSSAEAMRDQVNAPKIYQKLEQDYQQKEERLMECKNECMMIKKNIELVDKSIESKKKLLAKYSEKSIEDLQVNHIINMMPKVTHTLQLFKQKLTLRKLNKLETEVTNCFRYLLHKSNLITKVAIDAQSFALNLYDEQANLISKNRLSAGEKQLLAIALLWGLARVSGRNLPIAIDTPLGRLDSSHRHNLIERYFPTASHQVILLSTDTEIGTAEVEQLRQQEVIAREYLLDYDVLKNETQVISGYFRSN